MSINSIRIISRLGISESAFIDLISKGIEDVVGQSFILENIKLRFNQIKLDSFHRDDLAFQLELSIALEVHNEKSWYLNHIRLSPKLEIECQLTTTSDYPTIRLDSISLRPSDQASVSIFGFNPSLPKWIQRKLYNTIESKKAKYQQELNRLIRETVSNQLIAHRSFKLEFSTTIPTLILLSKAIHWQILIDNENAVLAFDLQGQLSQGLLAIPPIEIVQAGEANLNLSSQPNLRLNLSYLLLNEVIAGQKLDIKRLGQFRIEAVQMKTRSVNQLKVKIHLSGATEMELQFTVLIQHNEEESIKPIEESAEKDEFLGETIIGSNHRQKSTKLIIEDFELILKNKFLDLGAKIFENRIKSKIEDQLNDQIQQIYAHIPNKLSQIINFNKNIISFTKDDLAPDDIAIECTCHADGLSISCDSETLTTGVLHSFAFDKFTLP